MKHLKNVTETKRNMKQRNSKQGGITLIALVITIIVLVILATFTINSIYNMQIFNFASNTAKNYSETSNEEDRIIKEMENYLGKELQIGNARGNVTQEQYDALLQRNSELERELAQKNEEIANLNSRNFKLTYQTATKQLGTATDSELKALGIDQAKTTGENISNQGTVTLSKGSYILVGVSKIFEWNTSYTLTAKNTSGDNATVISDMGRRIFEYWPKDSSGNSISGINAYRVGRGGTGQNVYFVQIRDDSDTLTFTLTDYASAGSNKSFGGLCAYKIELINE